MLKGIKEKRFFLFGVLMLFALSVLVGCGGGGGGEKAPAEKEGAANTAAPKEEVKTYNLSLSHFYPATHDAETVVVQGWIADIAKATNGKVKIQSYPAGTLTPSTEIYEGVVKGVSDLGISCYAYNRGRFPVIETFMIPGIEYNNSKAASYAINEGIKKLNPKELQDVHTLVSWSTGPGVIYTTKKAVRTTEDLKGLQIGVTSGQRVEAMALLGGVGLAMPVAEWYEALSKNIIEGAISPIESVQGFRTGEISANYVTSTSFFYNQPHFLAINKDKWNSLPPDIQKTITDVTEKHWDSFAGYFDNINIKGWKWLNEKKKVEFITLSDAEKKNWLDKIKPLESNYVKTLNEKGLPGEEILKTVKEVVDQGNAKYPEKDVFLK